MYGSLKFALDSRDDISTNTVTIRMATLGIAGYL